MLFLGSFGLHIINGALKTGHATVKWKVLLLLRSFYKRFKDFSVGEYYIDWTGSELFPKKSCLVRWFENVDICQEALNVFGNMKKYTSIAKKLTATFAVRIVREVSSDELMPAKIAFFSSAASVLELFLLRFQTSAPIDHLFMQRFLILLRF